MAQTVSESLRGAPSVSEEVLCVVLALWYQGLTTGADMAHAAGVSTVTISLAKRRLGLSQRLVQDEQRALVLACWAAGMTMREMAEGLGMHSRTIARRMRDLGVCERGWRMRRHGLREGESVAAIRGAFGLR